ncbi:MAG: Asp-tRNA(Asn)/Glu-tRNA(Gln) amidotransferase subunit GatC [Thermodesulfobacteriota bacterium]
MKIKMEEVRHVADLARLDIADEMLEKFADQIGNILEYVATLNEVDTGGIAGTSHAIPFTNAFRDDVVRDHLDRETALANAPEQEEGAFVVPKVVG